MRPIRLLATAPATPRQRDLITARAHLEFERAALQYAAMDPDARATELDRIDTAIGAVEQEIAAEGLRGSIAPGHGLPASEGQRRAGSHGERRGRGPPGKPGITTTAQLCHRLMPR